MDREQRRFRAALEACTLGSSAEAAVLFANQLMLELDKANPDYVDPEALEGVIQERVAEAIRLERMAIRTAIKARLGRGIHTLDHRGDVSLVHRMDGPGATLCFSPEAAEHFSREVLP